MALQPCAKCGAQISSKAKVCPQCGAKPKQKTSRATMFFGGLFAIGVAYAVFHPTPEPAAKSTAPITAEDRQSNARFEKTTIIAGAIKARLREPDSVKWESIYANDDASVVCLEYRARNGFGGISLERTAYAAGKASTDGAFWNKHCGGKSMYNMRSVQHAI